MCTCFEIDNLTSNYCWVKYCIIISNENQSGADTVIGKQWGQNFVKIMCFGTKKVKTQQQQNKKSNIKTVAGAGNITRDLSRPKRIRYLCSTESTESYVSSQTI